MKIEEFFKKNQIELNHKKLVLAASAGPDSMALLDMLLKLSTKDNFTLIAAHFDHQLRKDSFKETELLEKFCRKNHIKLINEKWQKEDLNSGVEAAAREARYAFLTKTVKKAQADYLLTAHHGDDLIENILLKFIRSGNPSEMNSLQETGQMNGVKLLRPLFNFEKRELVNYDKENRIDYIVDSTNETDFAQRNRLRHHVVPLLKKENPNLVENAVKFSHQMTKMKNLAEEKFANISLSDFLGVASRLKKADLQNFSETEQKQFWQNAIWRKYHRRVNENLGNYHLEDYQDYIYLIANSKLNFQTPLKAIQPEKIFIFNNRRFLLTTIAKSDYTLIGDFLAEDNNFSAGSLTKGAKLLLKNGHHVKSKKKFAQAKIPDILRKFCLTIYQDGEPVFVEKTYRNQLKSEKMTQYFLYQLKNA